MAGSGLSDTEIDALFRDALLASDREELHGLADVVRALRAEMSAPVPSPGLAAVLAGAPLAPDPAPSAVPPRRRAARRAVTWFAGLGLGAQLAFGAAGAAAAVGVVGATGALPGAAQQVFDGVFGRSRVVDAPIPVPDSSTQTPDANAVTPGPSPADAATKESGQRQARPSQGPSGTPVSGGPAAGSSTGTPPAGASGGASGGLVAGDSSDEDDSRTPSNPGSSGSSDDTEDPDDTGPSGSSEDSGPEDSSEDSSEESGPSDPSEDSGPADDPTPPEDETDDDDSPDARASSSTPATS